MIPQDESLAPCVARKPGRTARQRPWWSVERGAKHEPCDPVVILRSGHHGGLGIVRSLGRLGVPVYCVDTDWWEPASSSRYCRGRFILKLESGAPEEINCPSARNRAQGGGQADSDSHHG